MPVIEAVIFDFDGTILDTETPDFVSWSEVYQSYEVELPLDLWSLVIGTNPSPVDVVDYLEEEVGKPLDRERLVEDRRLRYHALIAEETVREGIREYIHAARSLGLKVGVASSADRWWVESHLEKHGLAGDIDAIRTADDVNFTKPDPELYLAVLRALHVKPERAIAIEDSPNGIRAARAAGIYCVAVPNEITQLLDLSKADLILPSLKETSLAELVQRVETDRSRLSPEA